MRGAHQYRFASPSAGLDALVNSEAAVAPAFPRKILAQQIRKPLRCSRQPDHDGWTRGIPSRGSRGKRDRILSARINYLVYNHRITPRRAEKAQSTSSLVCLFRDY